MTVTPFFIYLSFNKYRHYYYSYMKNPSPVKFFKILPTDRNFLHLLIGSMAKAVSGLPWPHVTNQF
jgi:hypothetical protein